MDTYLFMPCNNLFRQIIIGYSARDHQWLQVTGEAQTLQQI